MELNFNNEEEYFDLETLITEGTKAKVPIAIEFPDGRKSKALIRPILAEDVKTISLDFNEPFEVITEVLKICLFNSKGEQLTEELINALPAGLPMKIGEEVFRISGISYDGNSEEFIRKISEDDLESFP